MRIETFELTFYMGGTAILTFDGEAAFSASGANELKLDPERRTISFSGNGKTANFPSRLSMIEHDMLKECQEIIAFVHDVQKGGTHRYVGIYKAC